MLRISRSIFGLTLAIVAFAAACGGVDEPFKPIDRSSPPGLERTAINKLDRYPFGNPSNAVSDPGDAANYLLIGGSSAMSYNDRRGTANWVIWKTIREDLGNALPRPDFSPDPRLPKWFVPVVHYDYSGSGYDRGHLVPSADRFSDPERNRETFFMTNIAPQAGGLNQYPWNEFEMYVRGQVRRGFDAYQIAGVYGDAGRLKNKVTVPTNWWKVALLVRRGDVPTSFGARSRLIAVDMPNVDDARSQPWTRFRTTVREIERRTGYDLFADLPADVQQRVETRSEMHSP